MRPIVVNVIEHKDIWNSDWLYQIRIFHTYMYVLVHTVQNGVYMYIPVCNWYVLVQGHVIFFMDLSLGHYCNSWAPQNTLPMHTASFPTVQSPKKVFSHSLR